MKANIKIYPTQKPTNMNDKNDNTIVRECTGCGHLDNKPLGVNSQGDSYLACCPDSDYKEVVLLSIQDDK